MDIARHLELEVVIEGIETDEQAEIVCAMGGARAQGFLFGRPRPPSQAFAAAMTDLEPQQSVRAASSA